MPRKSVQDRHTRKFVKSGKKSFLLKFPKENGSVKLKLLLAIVVTAIFVPAGMYLARVFRNYLPTSTVITVNENKNLPNPTPYTYAGELVPVKTDKDKNRYAETGKITYNQVLGILTPDNNQSRYIKMNQNANGFYGEIVEEGSKLADLTLVGEKDDLSEVNINWYILSKNPESSGYMYFFVANILKNLDPADDNRDGVDWLQDTLDITDSKDFKKYNKPIEGRFNQKKITLVVNEGTVKDDSVVSIKVVPDLTATNRYIGKYKTKLNNLAALHKDMIVEFVPTKLPEKDGKRNVKYYVSLKNIPTGINSYFLRINLLDESEGGLAGSNVEIARVNNKWELVGKYSEINLIKATNSEVTFEANRSYVLKNPVRAEKDYSLRIEVFDKQSEYKYLNFYDKRFDF